MIEFDIVWYGWDGAELGIAVVRRHDLSEAITAACNRLKRGAGDPFVRDAHGFFVRATRPRGR